jgi:hypothetical protein
VGSSTSYPVEIDGESVPGLVGGGYSENEDVINNRVVIDGSGTVVGSGVVGAATAIGSAINNTVIVNDGTIGVSGNTALIQPGQVYGGYITGNTNDDPTGNAERNAVIIKGGTIHDAVVGGFVQGPAGNAWNSATTTSGDGRAVANTVTVNGGTLNHHIIGGRAYTGYVGGNQVIIKGIAPASDVFDIIGGSSSSVEMTVYSNIVDIQTDIAHVDRIAGGDGYTATTNNKVIIDGDVTFSANAGEAATMAGGISRVVENNEVILNGGTFALDSGVSATLHIAGGLAESDTPMKAARSNKVSISGGTVLEGTSGNKIEVAGASIKSEGTMDTTDIAEDNKVLISGNTTLKGTIDLMGASAVTKGDGSVYSDRNSVEISGRPTFETGSVVNVYGAAGIIRDCKLINFTLQP